MKILKKNQLVILVIALMLITAGYLNYSDHNQSQTMETAMQIAELGDATLVSSNFIEEANEDNEEITVTSTNIESDDIQDLEDTEDTYFSSSRLERDNMYSQMLETYQEIYNNANSTLEQKNNALSEIGKINQSRNAIMIAENLIKTKGIGDVIIFTNENSVSIVTEKDLSQEQIAQIQNIVMRELNVNADIIHISTRNNIQE